MTQSSLDRPKKPKRTWRRRLSLGLDNSLRAVGLYGPALTVYRGIRSLNEQAIDRLADRSYNRPKVEGALRASLGVLPFPKLRERYNSGVVGRHLQNAMESDDLPSILEAMAAHEGLRRAVPARIGKRVCDLLSSDEGIIELMEASWKSLQRYPDSPFLIYLHTLALAKAGDFQLAHDIVTAAITRCQQAAASDGLDNELSRRHQRLSSVWRVVDSISRDNMTWADGSGYDDGEGGEGEAAALPDGAEDAGGSQSEDVDSDAAVSEAAVSEAPVSEAPAATSAASNGDDHVLVFSERLIQGRQHDRYLDVCKRNYDAAENLDGKFKAIKAMLRQGIRRIPNYQAAYDQARRCFEDARVEWAAVADRKTMGSQIDRNGVKTLAMVRLLASALQIARQLDLAKDIVLLEKALVFIAGKPKAVPALWTICAALVEGDAAGFEQVTTKFIQEAARDPDRDHELRDYFRWALEAQRYDLAHKLFSRLPDKSKRLKAMLQYVRILQRDGQFTRAATLARRVHESILARPHTVDAIASWNLLRRTGELTFAAETATWYSRIPQPKHPVGVLFVAPRSIEQMRRYPLVVLMEMKRNGWAVIPLVSGSLPLEKTGIARIDKFLGCITQEGRFDRSVEGKLAPISGFWSDVSTGRLRWNNINLDDNVREEGAIHRRRHTIDFSCPSLEKFLSRLVSWTQLTATVLENINRDVVSGGVRVGFMVLQQSRLPDVVARFYLEEFGDPERFFCLHSANGYQNYFVNFSSPVSTRTTIRNMTRSPQLRSASFPVPSDFEEFYKANKHRGVEMLHSVQDVARTRRSTGGQERPPEATACIERIKEWRDGGGKVACVFGKVVCDLGAPFDGGPAHADLQDFLNHAIESVRDSNTLLLIKPHPHETRHEVGVFLTEYFEDLINVEIPPNVVILGHRWFDLYELEGLIDLGVIYNGTTAAELGLLGIPSVVCSHFAPVDYPVGHVAVKSRTHFRRLLRFSQKAAVAKDMKERSAAWIYYMSGDGISVDYRYHSRQITNRVVYPPWWFQQDIERYFAEGDPNVVKLAERIIGTDRAA
jgi:tetratricopeptide (TPR) repeat protein